MVQFPGNAPIYDRMQNRDLLCIQIHEPNQPTGMPTVPQIPVPSSNSSPKTPLPNPYIKTANTIPSPATVTNPPPCVRSAAAPPVDCTGNPVDVAVPFPPIPPLPPPVEAAPPDAPVLVALPDLLPPPDPPVAVAVAKLVAPLVFPFPLPPLPPLPLPPVAEAVAFAEFCCAPPVAFAVAVTRRALVEDSVRVAVCVRSAFVTVRSVLNDRD